MRALNPGHFWADSGDVRQQYLGSPLSADAIRLVETALGYAIPLSYIALMQSQNGGIPVRTRHRTRSRTSWADDHIAITGIFSIGEDARYSLCGALGSRFWIDEWGYPPIGIYFADCPSAGHDMLCLDYRKNGPQGEPQVVHVDQELDYTMTVVAQNFAEFIRHLEHEDAFDAG